MRQGEVERTGRGGEANSERLSCGERTEGWQPDANRMCLLGFAGCVSRFCVCRACVCAYVEYAHGVWADTPEH